MARLRTSGDAVAAVALAVPLALCAGCASRGANAPAPVPQGSMAVATTPTPVPTPVLTMFDAVIVDVRADARVLTVKEDRTHATWMVSLPDPVRITGPGRADMRSDELMIGDHLRISGTSSIDLILKADTIDLLDNVQRP